ncbi:MAG: 3-oxoacyl-[acyl-carrier-protein] reductase [candidate division Zixibacteria bacterium]|nr:3-oxoacyl-[acyl-carrier-protein] reductase [candidate division Zixibacteria bacterium]NIW43294.1 3-oxoacyl-[acyl-carrier-protein] reductase [Gammaproteobacteria bacterium]NIR62272.1 3-oxoacyl-[acyl-carrier-protein] reductase [candidate division Zixibacteria bacterium]NIS44510.1 3-oxoacyl-[acyl-carrier-protein] reductase [candidate division Zixibacteria bacterium]NIT51374.1 3-oxoacyl-[acyl-carrier-protein] reductase [candidate division Zixibacteria bacterium]
MFWNDLQLEDKVAIVTGASRGIGRAIAIELARRGATVVINYNRSKEAADQVQTKISEFGGNSILYQADVSNFEQAQNLVKSTINELGTLDILVNNAGITRDKLFPMMSEEDWDIVQDINIKGTFNCSKAAVRHMMRKRSGRIINITSVAGQMGNPGQTNYSASKAAQIGFTKALAREIAARNITVNAIAAGYIDTEIWDVVSEEIQEGILQLIPLGRKGEPEEIANLTAFLASDQAAYITGQVIGVDGGMAMM